MASREKLMLMKVADTDADQKKLLRHMVLKRLRC